METDELYEQFVDNYFKSGESEIPASWPPELRDRCRFFLRAQEIQAEFPSQPSRSVFPPPSIASRSILDQFPEIRPHPSLTLHAPGEPGPPALARHEERYVVEEEIARGGMGRILLSFDRDFRRRIAMKVMLGTPGQRATRFLEEAQATAQLEHPNIAPVYDLGLDQSGTPFFTMKWIRGRNLKEISESGDDRYSLTRLVQFLQQASMGVHFANSRGVVHRDLKPQNIMVGDFDEVLVVDWGLAKIIRKDDREEKPAISTERSERDVATLDGTIQGSLPYMAPEQARGEVDEIDARTDVFGLGAILYEILTASPVHVGSSGHETHILACQGEIIPPTERSPGQQIPVPLERICLRALAPNKEERFQSAREFHDALQAYIEGIHDAERRAAEVRRLGENASVLVSRLREAEARVERLTREEDRLRGELEEEHSEEARRSLWELAEQCQSAREDVSSLFNQTTSAYLAALSIDPENREVRRSLATLYHDRLAEAEARGDREAVQLYEALLEQYRGGDYLAEFQGENVLRLRSCPAEAEVRLCRFEERGFLLAETGWRDLGTTPLETRLPKGSYLAILRRRGYEDVRCPFLMERGVAVEAEVTLHPCGSIPEGFVFIPGGQSIIGGDARTLPVLPREKVVVGDFFAGRFPVTLGEYCDFLNDAFTPDDPQLAEHIPSFQRETYVQRNAGGLLVPVSRLDGRMPVFSITAASAEAYCHWRSGVLGEQIRLLTEPEWERCARGADGRLYPWGNGFDIAFCKGGWSEGGVPFPDPVGSVSRDVSVFGVRDLSGCVREFCQGWCGRLQRPVRAGSWNTSFPLVFRADFRNRQREGNKLTDVGFRVCYDENRD